MTDHTATLHLKSGAIWEFRPDPRYGCFVHTTRYGNVYAILEGIKVGKAIWVARHIPVAGKNGWCIADKEVGAVEAVFPDGGRYLFP